MRIRNVVAAIAVGATLVIVEPAAAQAAARVCSSYTETYSYTSGGVRYWVRRPSVGYNTGDMNCTLRAGDYAPGAVRALQAALHCSDVTWVKVDGDFGSQTRQGVITLQTNRHVGVDGIYGPQTRGITTFAIFTDSGAFTDCNTWWG